MGYPLLPTLANIFMCKLELDEDVLTPQNLPFYNSDVLDVLDDHYQLTQTPYSPKQK